MSIAEKFLVQVISTNGLIRSPNLTKELERQEAPFVVSPGVVPNRLDYENENLHSKFLSNLICQRDLSLPEIGCIMAHKNTSANLLNSKHEFGLVFEDDAEITGNIDFKLLASWLSVKKPRIISLGWIPGYAIGISKDFQYDENIIKLITPSTCTFAYGINREAAFLLANKGNKIVDVPDWPINLFLNVEFSVANPGVAQAPEDPQKSIIGIRPSMIEDNTSVFKMRYRLFTSLVTLISLSVTKKIDFTARQIFHRVLLQNLFYKYGKSMINAGKIEPKYPNLIFIPKKINDILSFFRLTNGTL